MRDGTLFRSRERERERERVRDVQTKPRSQRKQDARVDRSTRHGDSRRVLDDRMNVHGEQSDGWLEPPAG